MWYIKSGMVDVFSIGREGNEIKGARTFLFSAESGNILMGMDLEASFSERCFLAAGNINTILIKVSLNSVFSSQPDIEVLSRMTDKWISDITSGIARETSLRYDISVSAGSEERRKVFFQSNKKIRAKKGVLWLNIESDSISMLESEILRFEEPVYFPITDNSWILSAKEFEAEPVQTNELISRKGFRDYLELYHRKLLDLEELNIRMQLVDDFVRNRVKLERQKELTREAVRSIESVFDNTAIEKGGEKSESSIFLAAKILADHLNIKIWEPPADKDKSEPGLREISQFSKFAIRQLTLQDNWSTTDSSAFLSFTTDTKNPAVLIPNSIGKYKIYIPAENIESKLTIELAARIDSDGYTFYKPFPQKTINVTELVKFIFSSSRKEFIYLLAAGSIGGLLSLFLPMVTGVILDSVIPASDYTKLLGLGLSLVMATLAFLFAQIVRSLSFQRLDSKMDYVVQSALWDRLINLPISFFKKFSSGELASKANSLGTLKQVLSLTVINTVIYNAFLIFNLILLFYYDWLLGLLSSLLFSLFITTVIILGIKIKEINNGIIKIENGIASLVNQLLNSISKIRIAGVENLAFKLWADKYVVQQKGNLSLRKYSNSIAVLNAIFPILATIFIYYFFTSERYIGFSAGLMLSFLTAFNVYLMSVMQISNVAVTLFQALPLYDNSKEILNALPEHTIKKESINELKGEIEINHLFFKYDKEGEYILSDISLSIKPGEFVAIVGSSGSGKTTLLRMLLGFETPELGTIYFDKHNINSIDPSSLRRRMGTVMQNTRLMPGNIYSNIAGVSNYSVEYVNDVCKLIGLDVDLKSMPMGLFTMISPGLSTLSGGQRQKILIARAIINKPSVLLLDEATSALDNESQNILSCYFNSIQATRIIVAHRLSTIKEADTIYVMEKGRIVESGTYSGLYEKKGVFTELVKRQLLNPRS